ncbi:unnamed protein product, partial [Trichogramma brassicae]
VNREVVRRIARTVHRPYRYIKQPKLRPEDPPRRLRFAQWFVNKERRTPGWARRICFTDESTFTQAGVFNKQNSRYWAPQNPKWVRDVENQHRWSVNVWGGILGDRLVGPVFFDGPLNGEMYLDMLRNELPRLLEENPVAHLNMWWQQDGASPHNARPVTDCLNEMFGRRWIGYRARGVRKWPPRSPDLTPLDFYLWGRLKDICYQEEPTTQENMIERIRAAWNQITPEELARVRGHLVRVMQCAVEHEGHHVQPHMKY